MKTRFLLSKILVTLLASAMIFSACSGSEKDTTASQGVAGENSSQTDIAGGDLESILWYIRSAEPNNMESVMTAANEIVVPALDAKLEIIPINPGDYNDKMQIIMSAGETFDIAWTAEWANKYDSNVSRGAYVKLDQYMTEEYMPAILEAVPEGIWGGVKVNGGVYGIPNMQVMYVQPGMWFRKDMVEKYNIDVDSVKSWEDLTPIYQTIKDNEPTDVFAYRGTMNGSIVEHSFVENPDSLISNRMFMYNHETGTVYNDYFARNMDTLKLFRSWYESGFVPNDAATLQDENSMIRAGKLFTRYNRIKPGGPAEFANNNGFEIVNLPVGIKRMTTTGVQASLNAVSVTSKNPERAVRLLDLVYGNKDLFNTIIFGIEGQDYEKLDDKHIRTLEGGYLLPAWMIGNQFNAYLLEGQPDDVWEETIKANSEAEYDPLLSFILDRSPIETELSSVEAVLKEYEPILLYGLDDPEPVLAEMMNKMEAAGLSAATEEIQRQVDAFKAG